MTWEKAQEWERSWWSSCSNTYGEETKQLLYAKRMGLQFFHDGKSPFNIDLKGKSVLDIGGGPASLLLKCVNFNKAKVVDPLDIPSWVKDRYGQAGIAFEQKKAEAINENSWDEGWIYNVLQHSEDPGKVIANALKATKTLRIFEWIDTVKNEGHPHVLTEAGLNQMLGGKGTVETLNEPTLKGKCYYGVFTTNPLIDTEHGIEKNREIWQNVPWEGANLMGESWSPSPEWKQALIEEFSKIIKPGSAILEIGPGAGRFTEFLQKLASHLTIVDLSDKCISLCKERFKGCSNITYFANDGADLSFIESNSQDYIFTFDCFNHMSPQDVERYIAQFPRILRDNGICIVDYGTKGAVGGWRSSLTNEMFLQFLKDNKLNLVRQFDSWGEGYQVAQKHDMISVASKSIKYERYFMDEKDY